MIYLHIGLPKTGTTTIQAGLLKNRKKLRDNGFLYPESASQIFGHHELVHIVNDQNEINHKKINELKQEIISFKEEEPEGHIIISSEAIVSLRERVSELISILEEIDQVTCMVYLRRQDNFLRSFWSMEVARLNTVLPINPWMQEALENNTYGILRYFKLLTQLRESSSDLKLDVLIYEAEKLKGIFKCFLLNCGVRNLAEYSNPNNENISDTVVATELLRRYRKHFEGKLTKVQFKNKIIPIVRDMSIEQNWKIAIRGKHYLTEETYKKIRSKYSVTNRRAIETFLPPENYGNIFLQYEEYQKRKFFNLSNNDYIKNIDKTDLDNQILRLLKSKYPRESANG